MLVGRGLFSCQSLMSVVTDTTNHENGVGVVVLGWQTIRAWIPAYAGMTVGVVGAAIFRGILHAALGLHTSDENVCGAKAGNHKGICSN